MFRHTVETDRANGRGKSQSAMFSRLISKHHTSKIHHGMVTVHLRMLTV